MKSKLLAIVSLWAILSMLLSACGAKAQATVPPASSQDEAGQQPATATPTEPAWEGPKILHGAFQGTGDITTIDPALVDDTASIQIVDEAFIGPTYADAQTGAVKPGMALSWDAETNADGTQTLTFHLRDDVPWVRWNGEAVETVKTCDGSANRMVTAHDFVYGIRRNLDPALGAGYAYLLGYMLKGAADFNSGVTADFSTVGAKAVDDTTLEMTFLSPAVYNVQIAGLWVARAQPEWVIEGDCDGALQGRGERWTEPGFFQSYGPFTVKEWIHDSSITLVKNPYWPGTEDVPQPRIDEIYLRILESAPSLAEYEAGNLDYLLTVPPTEMDRIKSDPVLSQGLHISPDTCSSYIGFNTQAPFVNDVRVRRALSLAVDRHSLIDNVTKGGEIAAQWFAVPGIVGVPTLADHPDLGVKYDPDEGRAELQSYLDEKKITADKLDLTLMFTTAGSLTPGLPEAIQQMWKSTLGVNARLLTLEVKAFLAAITGKDTPQIFVAGWCQDYPDASNWDREVFAAGGAANPIDNNGNPAGGVGWKNDEFEKLVRDAAVESDPAKRVELYARTEQLLVWEDAVIIPMWWWSRIGLTKPYITRTYGQGGVQAFEEWDIKPH